MLLLKTDLSPEKRKREKGGKAAPLDELADPIEKEEENQIAVRHTES